MTTIAKTAEQTHLKILNEIRDGLFTTDQTGVITFVNEPLAAMHGLETPEEMIGRHFNEFVSPEFRTEVSSKFKKAVEEESYSEVVEFPTIRKDGGIIFIQLKHGPIVNNGRIVGTAGVIRDVTDRKRAEQALAASEKKYRALVENMSDVVFILDQTGKLLFITPSATRLLGYEQSEMIGHSIREFTYKEDLKPALNNISHAISEKETISNEYRLVRKNGSILWVQTFTRPLFEGDDVVAVQGSFWDITERKQAEEALKASERKFLDLITNIREVLYTLDRDGRITFVSPSVESLSQYRDSEIIGHHMEEFIFRDDMPRLYQDLQNFLSGIGKTENEYRMVIKSGEIRWMRTRSSLLYEGAEIIGVQGILSDITERKRSEEALRESEEKFRSLVETTSDWIWEVDANGVYTYASPRVRDLLGYEPEEVLGRRPFEFMPPDESARIKAEFYGIAKERKAFFGLENVNIRKDGRRVVLETSGVPRLDGRGNLLGFRGIDRDITGRKRAEDLLQSSHDELEYRVARRTSELERKNRELQEFAFVAAHDLSEPLRKIQIFGSFLSEKKAERLDDEAKDRISRMTDAANRMQKLLDALLRYSRIETKGQEFRPTRLNDVAREVTTDLEVRIRKLRARVEVGPLPTVMGDPNQLRQLFQNLIANAIKYRRSKAAPHIKIHGEEDDRGCRIFVEDNGIGFDEKYLDKIFQPFQRLHGKLEYPGLGIGLSICKKIVERHGGTISARSTSGKGSTFIVALPVYQQKAKP